MTDPLPGVDVEACVRLLTRVAFLIERVGFDLDIAEMVGQEPEEENPPEDINLIEAEQQGQADGLRALKAALPGMGKAMEENERLRAGEREATATLKDVNAALERMIRQCADAAALPSSRETP